MEPKLLIRSVLHPLRQLNLPWFSEVLLRISEISGKVSFGGSVGSGKGLGRTHGPRSEIEAYSSSPCLWHLRSSAKPLSLCALSIITPITRRCFRVRTELNLGWPAQGGTYPPSANSSTTHSFPFHDGHQRHDVFSTKLMWRGHRFRWGKRFF